MSPLELDFDSCYRAVSARDARFDGRFYTAVTTTRIYCRPICPARTPSSRNVRFYRHAASAEAAGFRPCKRCRPELSPGDPGWDLRGDLIGRALRLIDDGAADEHGVAGLAGRLHITERHLHRLFVAELGVGPLAVARTKRLLLAKQLLTETGLPVTEVAFAAGFGSVRQFNATMRETYGFTPSELRATAGGPKDAHATGPATLRLRLHRREPFDVEGVFAFLASRAIPGLEVADRTSYARTVPGGTITLTPRRDHIALDVAVDDTRQLARVVARCRRLLDLDADPDAITAVLGETSLAPLVKARPGLRVPGAFDGFELAVRAVVGQQISVAGARTLLGRIVARAAAPESLFPTPGHLLDTDLTGLGLTNRRIDTLKHLAARLAEGRIDLDGGQDPAEAVTGLLEVPGIGPWTASYIALRALRDPDAWPTGDLVLKKRMACLGIPDNHIERWRPWRAYAALHLWSSS
ncbi:DNA-3-methyladenine glycosylase 2 family protein [Nonomuraea sp. NPDC046802]|uniref:DNA-3-methyladenine glycosylase 2 family protein n=1 Tax=Nonomuraea sp. NPDC046802 TaxID=3154919 RepID=UPI0033F894E1